MRRRRHSSKRFILRSWRPLVVARKPARLVQTAVVDKIVVFVDNKSREGRVWRAVYLDGVAPLDGVRSLNDADDGDGGSPTGNFLPPARKPGPFPRHRPRVRGIPVRPRSHRAIAKRLLSRRGGPRDRGGPPEGEGGDFFYFRNGGSLLVSRPRFAHREEARVV